MQILSHADQRKGFVVLFCLEQVAVSSRLSSLQALIKDCFAALLLALTFSRLAAAPFFETNSSQELKSSALEIDKLKMLSPNRKTTECIQQALLKVAKGQL